MDLKVFLFYILTLIFTFLLARIQGALGLSSRTVILSQWGPGLAALIMVLVFRKKKQELSIFDPEIPRLRYLLSALIPAGGALLVYVSNRFFWGEHAFVINRNFSWVLVLWMPLGSLGEELGWRAYLHKRLDPDLSGLASSLLVSVLWAFWHVGLYANGALYMAYFVLLMVSYSLVMYALVADMGFNLLLAGIFHMVVNIPNLFSFAVIDEVALMKVNSLVWGVIAVVAVIIRWSHFKGRGKVR